MAHVPRWRLRGVYILGDRHIHLWQQRETLISLAFVSLNNPRWGEWYTEGVPWCNVKSMKEAKFNAEGEIVGFNAHEMTEKDYWYMTRELRTHFSCLSGRLYSLIEELGLPEKQEAAAKRHLKTEVWERYNDFCKVMRSPYYKEDATWGIPDEE